MKMTEKKMTKKDLFNLAISETSNPMLVEFFTHELELLEKKNASRSKSNANKEVNDVKRNAIIELLSDGTPRTATEIAKELGHTSNQQTMGLVRPLLADKVLVRFMEKRKAFFTVAD